MGFYGVPFFMPLLKLHTTKINYVSIRVEKPITDEYVLIFLHEALGSIGQWKGFPDELCKALLLDGIVYERQGHGSSSPFDQERTADYLHDYAYNELPAILEEILPLSKKVILIGHSDGGTIALLYAAKFPERVKAAVTMAAHVINEPETIAGIQPAVDAFQAGKLEGLKKYHGDKTEALFFAWANTWKNSFFENWNICEELNTINAPILAIQGAKDQYGTIKQLELIEKNIKVAVTTVELNNCGHHPHLELPNEVVEKISQWLKSTVTIF